MIRKSTVALLMVFSLLFVGCSSLYDDDDMSALFYITIAFAITSSITTFDKRLTQAKLRGNLPPDEPSLPSWVAFVFWIHIGLIISMLVINWKYALIVLFVGFIFGVLPVWETIGNILMRPFRPKNNNNYFRDES